VTKLAKRIKRETKEIPKTFDEVSELIKKLGDVYRDHDTIENDFKKKIEELKSQSKEELKKFTEISDEIEEIAMKKTIIAILVLYLSFSTTTQASYKVYLIHGIGGMGLELGNIYFSLKDTLFTLKYQLLLNTILSKNNNKLVKSNNSIHFMTTTSLNCSMMRFSRDLLLNL